MTANAQSSDTRDGFIAMLAALKEIDRVFDAKALNGSVLGIADLNRLWVVVRAALSKAESQS